jgi:hypothetical protein
MKRALLVLAAMVVVALVVSARQLRAEGPPSCDEVRCEYNHFCTDELPFKCDLCFVNHCVKVAD